MYHEEALHTDPAVRRQCLAAFLAAAPDCDAIIVQHAPHVSSLYRICADLGRRIPRDLGVICMQDPEILLDFAPAVSGFRLPEFALGEQGVELLNRIISEGIPVPEMQMRYAFTPRPSL